MEKKEKKADLEQLLNSLIEKGWKPYGMENYDRFIIESAWDMCFRWKYPWADWESAFDYNYDYFKIRELVSIDSWLWQFVCENKMEKKMEKNHRWIWINSWAKSAYQSYPVYTMERYEYRLIESALCDEDKLEEFLLDNIKVDE